MCEITGVKRNRLNYIVLTQTFLYNIKLSTALIKAIIFPRLFLVSLERIFI